MVLPLTISPILTEKKREVEDRDGTDRPWYAWSSDTHAGEYPDESDLSEIEFKNVE